MAYTAALKVAGLRAMWVRVPPRAPLSPAASKGTGLAGRGPNDRGRCARVRDPLNYGLEPPPQLAGFVEK